MVDLPTRKVRATDIPSFALAVRCQHERALARANQYSYPAHPALLPAPRAGLRLFTTSRIGPRRGRCSHPGACRPNVLSIEPIRIRQTVEQHAAHGVGLLRARAD